MMDVTIQEETDREMTFAVEGIAPAFANALRRTAMSRVPTMAVEEVEFVNNTSGLFDEMVAHRIGMVPWRFPQDHYNVREECDCDGEGCTKCRVEFVLKKEGEGTVYASDLKPTDKEVETPNPETVLAKLLEDQEMNLEARARLGYGTEHAKFQAANVSYKYYPVVRVNGDEVDNSEEAARVAPDAVRNADGPIEADEDIVYAFEQTLDLEEGDEIELEERDDKFLFQVESVSGLTAREVVSRALDVLEDEVEAVKDESTQALANL